MICDLKNQTVLGQTLNTCQEDFNKFCKKLGLEITQISITHMNVIKEGENQAISLFNTLVKSDFGSQLMGQITPHLKNYVAETLAENNQKAEPNSSRMNKIPEVGFLYLFS